MATPASPRVFAFKEMDGFGRALVEAVSREALRRRAGDETAPEEITFGIDVEVRYEEVRPSPGGPDAGEQRRPKNGACCVCWRSPSGERTCIGWCCT
jgi:hypothetical protein